MPNETKNTKQNKKIQNKRIKSLSLTNNFFLWLGGGGEVRLKQKSFLFFLKEQNVFRILQS